MREIDDSNGGDTVPGSESIQGFLLSEISLYAMAIECEMKRQYIQFNIKADKF